MLEQLERMSERMYVSPMSQAIVHVGLGSPDVALDWLEWADELGAILLVTIDVDPRYEPLRGEARFQTILTRLGLGGS